MNIVIVIVLIHLSPQPRPQHRSRKQERIQQSSHNSLLDKPTHTPTYTAGFADTFKSGEGLSRPFMSSCPAVHTLGISSSLV